MFWHPVDGYEVDPAVYRAIDLLFMLHADHEQNCSTSTVRMVGSSKANLFAAISSGVCALWGPLHGGANQAVMEMLESIHHAGGDPSKFIVRAKDKNDPFRLMGFGHRVYKSFDPRAAIIKAACHDLLERMDVRDPLLDIALSLEQVALSDEYFVQRRLYPNVDFYSGIIYRALGIPKEMFTVMFALGRLPGWIAHWKELIEDPKMRISRPRQIYTGEPLRRYQPMKVAPEHHTTFNTVASHFAESDLTLTRTWQLASRNYRNVPHTATTASVPMGFACCRWSRHHTSQAEIAPERLARQADPLPLWSLPRVVALEFH